MSVTRKIALLIGAAALSACTGSLLETELPASSLHVIAPAPAPPRAQTPLAVDLTIGTPHVAPGLETDRIAVLKGRQLDYYRAARWGAPTRALLHTFLVDSFEDRGMFRSVTAEQARVAADYVLDIDVRDFQAEYASDSGAPTVRVAMLGRVIRVVDRKLVATIAASADSVATDNRLHAVTAAFEAATQKVAAELVQQTAAAVAGDASALSAARGSN
jgi:cholesterol transport system auxiliary component